MTAQPPLNLVAEPHAVPIGPAAALVEDDTGGRVYVYGSLIHVWQAGDDDLRRLAAVQLIDTKAALVRDVAFAFGVGQPTLWRWRKQLTTQGLMGLVSEKRGPKGPSRVTPEVHAEILRRRAKGETLQQIANATGVSISTAARIANQETVDDEEEGSTSHTGRSDDHTAANIAAGKEPARDSLAGDDEAEDEDGAVLPVLPDPVDRRGERGLARTGLLDHARPVFAPAARVPLAGLFLALPALETTGLLACAKDTFGALPNGFYGLDTTLLEAVLRTLADEPRAEGASRIDPTWLGRVLGMDRAPEVKTIRRKMHLLARSTKSAELLQAMAQAKLTQNDHEGLAALLYVDGHIRAYYGTRKIAKQHSTRLRFPAPATAETWVSDADGDPVLVVMATPGASLAGELRRLLPTLRETIGDERRVLVGFDRGGWSPALFAHMYERGFDVLTWRKGATEDIAEHRFRTITRTDPDTGRTRTWTVADTGVELPTRQNKKNPAASSHPGGAGEDSPPGLWMRQISVIAENHNGGVRQIHLLTTRWDLPPGELLHRMGSRWRQENHFRYARMHFDLDAHDAYATSDDDLERLVPNPAKKQAYTLVQNTKARLDRAQADFDARALDERTKVGEVIITNAEHTRMIAPVLEAQQAHEEAKAAHARIPARLPLGELAPGQQVLDTEVKLLTHAIRIAAFNTLTALVRDLRLHTNYARAGEEGHKFIRQVLTHSGDIDPNEETGILTITLDPLHAARATKAAAELCDHLNNAQTVYPGTNLTLRFQVKDPNTMRK